MIRSMAMVGCAVLLLVMSLGPADAQANRSIALPASAALTATPQKGGFASSESATLLLVAGVLTGMAWILRRPAGTTVR